MNLRVLLGVFTAFLALSSSESFAVWELQEKGSHLHFVSVKNNSIGEVHEFKDLKGTVETDGTFNLAIDTRSVETKVDIRNGRMRKVLFQSGLYLFAIITGKVEYFNPDTMTPGVIREIKVPVVLELHGTKKTLDATFTVYKVDDKTIGVSLYKPLIINTADFGMVKGVQTLMDMAGLKSISTAVPITGHFVFTKKNSQQESVK